MTHDKFQVTVCDLRIRTQKPRFRRSGKAHCVARCDSDNYGVRRTYVQFGSRYVWLTPEVAYPCVLTQHNARQTIGNSSNAIGEQDWKMEHVEEIGSSLRNCPFAPWHLFGPNRFLRDLVMREPIKMHSRNFEGRSPNCQVESTVTGHACVRRPLWVNLNPRHSRSHAR